MSVQRPILDFFSSSWVVGPPGVGDRPGRCQWQWKNRCTWHCGCFWSLFQSTLMGSFLLFSVDLQWEAYLKGRWLVCPQRWQMCYCWGGEPCTYGKTKQWPTEQYNTNLCRKVSRCLGIITTVVLQSDTYGPFISQWALPNHTTDGHTHIVQQHDKRWSIYSMLTTVPLHSHNKQPPFTITSPPIDHDEIERRWKKNEVETYFKSHFACKVILNYTVHNSIISYESLSWIT